VTPPAILPDLSAQDYLDAVKHADTPSEMKARILLCREMGHLSDEETEEWIAMVGLENE
jgi:hypothetical protein